MKTEDKKQYFVNGVETTKEAYMLAERDAGFYPKTPGTTATASFTGPNGVSGRVEYN